MANLADQIRQKVGEKCCSRRCRQGQASLKLPRRGVKHVLVNLDCEEISAVSTAKKCDFLFVDDSGRVIAIELKQGKPDILGATVQLQGGANFAESLISWPQKIKFTAVVTGRGITATQVRVLQKKARVRFLGRPYPIRYMQNGNHISNVFRA